MQKPINRNIYNVLKLLEDWKTQWLYVEEIFDNDRKVLLMYDWLLSEKYVSIETRQRFDLKEQYKDKIDPTYLWEEDVTYDWKQVPFEWYEEMSDSFIVLTLEWRIFLENYSNFWKRLNYRFEDYHIIMPLIFGFLWWVVSSLLIYLIIWR